MHVVGSRGRGVCAGGRKKELFRPFSDINTPCEKLKFWVFWVLQVDNFLKCPIDIIHLWWDYGNSFAPAILGSRFAHPIASKRIRGREKLKKAGLARPVLQLRSSASDQNGSKNKAVQRWRLQVVEETVQRHRRNQIQERRMLDWLMLLNRHGGRCEVLPSWIRIGCQKKKLGNRPGAVKVPELHRLSWSADAPWCLNFATFRCGWNLHLVAIFVSILWQDAAGEDVEMWR